MITGAILLLPTGSLTPVGFIKLGSLKHDMEVKTGTKPKQTKLDLDVYQKQ